MRVMRVVTQLAMQVAGDDDDDDGLTMMRF
jgi:hypothetical protein